MTHGVGQQNAIIDFLLLHGKDFTCQELNTWNLYVLLGY